MKTCNRCEKQKPRAAFSKNCRAIDGLQGRCKECDALSHQEFIAANPGYAAKMQAARRELARIGARLGDWDTYARLRLTAIRKRAQRTGIDFTLTTADLIPLYKAGCALTGYQFSSLSKERSPLSPSIDRIDSSKGYTPDNIRAVCHALNVGMNEWGFEKIAPLWKAAINHSAGPL